MSHGHIVPERNRRLRECDAVDIALEMLGEARACRYSLALFLLPDGEFKVTASRGPAFDYLHAHNSAALVGVYTGEADVADVVEDVWARAERIEMEWSR